VQPLHVTHFTDPGCPWAYSAWPALTSLMWRYGDGLRWRHVLIGLTEEREQYLRRGYTPALMARTRLRFGMYGMPFGGPPKDAVAATSRACRAVVAARRQDPALEVPALRALQWLQFTTADVIDDDAALERALEVVPGLDAAAAVAAIDDDDVWEAYEEDRALSRTAGGGPAEAQGKTARTDGPVRYTAPTLVFEAEGALLGLAADGEVVVEQLGDGALWAPAQRRSGSTRRFAARAMAASSGETARASASS